MNTAPRLAPSGTYHLHRLAGLAAAGFLLALTSCSGGEGGMFQEVTLDPARERVNALEDDTTAVNQTILDYFAASDQGNTQALAGLFTERAEVYTASGESLGAAAFIKEIATSGSRPEQPTTFKLKGATLARPYGWAKVQALLSPGGPEAPGQSSALFTFAVEKRGEVWLISHLHITGSGS